MQITINQQDIGVTQVSPASSNPKIPGGKLPLASQVEYWIQPKHSTFYEPFSRLLKNSQVSARQGKIWRKSAVYTQ